MRPSYLDRPRVETHDAPPVLPADMYDSNGPLIQDLIAARNEATGKISALERELVVANNARAEAESRAQQAQEQFNELRMRAERAEAAVNRKERELAEAESQLAELTKPKETDHDDDPPTGAAGSTH